MDTRGELIEACKKGKSWAHEELYRLYKSKLMGIALRYAGSREHAQDILQDAFIQILTKCKSYTEKGSFEGWMTRIVINTAISFNRKWDYRRNELSEEFEETLTVEARADRRLSEKELLELVQKLPAGYRTIFNMYAIDGYTHEEISKELGITSNTSKTQYMKARNRLAEWVVKHDKMTKHYERGT